MTRLALFGAGGKMGMRLGRNLKSSAYEVAAVELSSEGQRRIESELGWKVVDADTATKGAEIVVLAVPDTAIGKVAHAIIGKLKPGVSIEQAQNEIDTVAKQAVNVAHAQVHRRVLAPGRGVYVNQRSTKHRCHLSHVWLRESFEEMLPEVSAQDQAQRSQACAYPLELQSQST